jgi:hypothetical protein
MYAGHLKQVNSYALHRGYFVKKFPETSLRPSYFAPSLLLLGTALGWVLGPLWALGLGLYFGLAALDALRMALSAPAEKRGLRLWWLTFSGIAATHYSYGWHFLRGLFSARLHEDRAPTAA